MMKFTQYVVQRTNKRYIRATQYEITPAPGFTLNYNNRNDLQSVNLTAPTYIDMYAQHAQHHGGKLLLPVASVASVSRMEAVQRFLRLVVDADTGMYTFLDARIDLMGQQYSPGLSFNGYTTVPTLYYGEKKLWFALSDIHTGEADNLDEFQYYTVAGAQPLAEALKYTSTSLIYATRVEA
ncbi:hypothetical protein GCM10007377_15100 [Galliscardovia ingluviei]|uniref:Uncharacterized protein n=1 Tax=Galliscardovia ingluviei TaxID=1769422 RepID=A0A8J3AKK8_9BIFI|nr:hypothetical protein [Galliscardovia ingluviei]GGI15278.1 hypothetical protein GCM10007377_15100 [Galliscardovia ingluviei]